MLPLKLTQFPPALPWLDTGDILLFPTEGVHCEWHVWVRQLSSDFKGVAYVVVVANFSTQWSNPLWASVESPLSATGEQGLDMMESAAKRFGPVPAGAVALDKLMLRWVYKNAGSWRGLVWLLGMVAFAVVALAVGAVGARLMWALLAPDAGEFLTTGGN